LIDVKGVKMNLKFIELAKEYIRIHYSDPVIEIERLTTGLCHYVYRIKLESGFECVIRIGRKETAALIKGGIYWNGHLADLNIPIPKLLHYDQDLEYPYMIIEKLEGRDLCYVYDHLTPSEKEKLAKEIVEIQNEISELEPNNYFGYATKYFDEYLEGNTSWKSIIHKSIMRSKGRLEETRIFDFKYIDLLLLKLEEFDRYFAKIQTLPFLDDITTKNVMIKDGTLTGICDIDEVCFGDKLQHLALTRMALISQKSNLDYIDYLINEYTLSDTELKILDFYTAVSCVDFMSEMGQKFNKDEIPEIDNERIEFLESVFCKYY
jgi:aminoglycoside phosphotransferase